MIDIDKYKGHTPADEWRMVFYHKLRKNHNYIEGLNIEAYHLGQMQVCSPEFYPIAKANQDLVKDAPLILEDYKRLRELKNLYSDRLMKAYDWIAHWLGEENMRMFMDTVGVTDEGDIPYMDIIKGDEEE